VSAAFNHIPPVGCPANLDTLPTHHASKGSHAIPAPAAVGPHSVRLRRCRRMVPQSSRFCAVYVRVRACVVVDLALFALFPLVLFR